MTVDARQRAVQRRLRPLTQATFLMGFLLWEPVEKLYMTDIGFDAASIGVMAAAYAALTPLIEIPSGVLADRWSRRGVLIIAALALAVTALVGGLSRDVATYVASGLILAVYFAMYSGTMDAAVYDTVLDELGSSETFERQIGRLRFVESLALVSGALAGGLVAELTSARLTYFLTVPFAAASVIALLRFSEPRLHRQAESTTLRRQIGLTWRSILGSPGFRPILALNLLAALLLAALIEFGPLWLVEAEARAGLYGPYWALLMATLGLGGLLTSRVPLQWPAVAVGFGALLLSASLLLACAGTAVVIGAQVVLVLLLLMVSLRAAQLLHDAVPSTVRSGVASGVSALGWLCFVPFSGGFGFVARSRGVDSAAWMLVAATALTALALVAAARREKLPTSPDEALGRVS